MKQADTYQQPLLSPQSNTYSNKLIAKSFQQLKKAVVNVVDSMFNIHTPNSIAFTRAVVKILLKPVFTFTLNLLPTADCFQRSQEQWSKHCWNWSSCSHRTYPNIRTPADCFQCSQELLSKYFWNGCSVTLDLLPTALFSVRKSCCHNTAETGVHIHVQLTPKTTRVPSDYF